MLTAADRTQLIEQARAVLDRNRVGRYTKPAPQLYPHQWSWDSAFIAMAYAHYDQARAEEELRSLFEAQWSSGLLPHIVFNPQASDYFPNPATWRTSGDPRVPADRLTSGIVQPPVHATAALHLLRHAQDQARAREFLAELFPRLRDWHAYLYRERDPRGEGLVYIRHPWESGQDNSPLWDAALGRIRPRPGDVPAYRRVDTRVVDAADRPSDAEYDRYMYLVKLFADRGYDEARIYADCPYLIQDVLFNALLCQADRDLAEIARALGEDAAPFEAWAAQPGAARSLEPTLPNHHRLQFVCVPKHTSWLNQIEIWFSILVRRVIKRGNFPALETLRERMLAFIDYFNRTAKPFRWTYTGRPLSM